MTILPIVDRELRVASRRRATYWVRFSSALVAIFFCACVLYMLRRQPAFEVGRALFSILGVVAFALSLLGGLASAADCLSEEKREGTLGLLFLTDLRGYDVVLGKLAARSLNSIYGLVAIFPVLALPLLLGGVAPEAFGRLLLILGNTLFLSAAAGVLVSACSFDSRRALAGTFGLLLFLTGGLPFLRWLQVQAAGRPLPVEFDAIFLYPSPGFGFAQAMETAFTNRVSTHFWPAALTVHLIGWFLLALALLVLPRAWQDRPAGRRGLWFRSFWRRLAYGTGEQRSQFRRRSLNLNPVYWLGARYRAKRVFVWMLLGGTMVVWFWGYLRFPHDWLSAGMGIWGPIIAHTAVKLWVASESCRLFSELRRNGGLELLLSTPLSVPEILRGQWRALRSQFGSSVFAILAADLLLMLVAVKHEAGDFSGQQEIAMVYLVLMAMFVMDIWALGWVGMWNGLTSKRVIRAAGGAVARILVLPWCVFCASVILYAVLRLYEVYAPKSTIPVFLWWFAIGAVNNYVFITWARRRLHREFRGRAAEAFDRTRRGRWWRKERPAAVVPGLLAPGN